MHFSPVSDFPLFSKNVQTLWTIFKILPFPEKFFDFHPPKFLMILFFCYHQQISNFFPIFSVSVNFLPLFRENYYFLLTFTNTPPVFEKIICFLHTLCVFRFPPTLTMMHLCITHDAFMHHPMHVLDAPSSSSMTAYHR